MEKFKEYWKTVVIDGVEHPRYQVSNFGRVKSMDCNHTKKEKLLKLFYNKQGYLRIELSHKKYYVHRLVAEAFIPNSEGKPEIDHINGNRADNIVLLDDDGKTILYTNLRWCTSKENKHNPITINNYKTNHPKYWLGKFGADNASSVSVVQLTLDGTFIKKWDCVTDVQRELGIFRSSIAKCCQGLQKSAGGFKWMYYEDWVKKTKKPPVRYINHISEIKPLF